MGGPGPYGGPGGPGGPGGYPGPGGWGGPGGGGGFHGQPGPGVWAGNNDHYGQYYGGGPQPPQQPGPGQTTRADTETRHPLQGGRPQLPPLTR